MLKDNIPSITLKAFRKKKVLCPRKLRIALIRFSLPQRYSIRIEPINRCYSVNEMKTTFSYITYDTDTSQGLDYNM